MEWVVIVLDAIANLVASNIGNRAFDSLIDQNGNSTVSTLSQVSIEMIKGIVGQGFHDHDIAEAKRQLDTVVVLMAEFDKAPGQPDRLENATVINTQTLALLTQLGADGTSLFLLASFAHIAILQTRFKTFRAEGEKQNAKAAISSYIAHAHSLEPYWSRWVSSISPVQEYIAEVPNPHPPPPVTEYTFYLFYIGGLQQKGYKTPAEAQAARDEYISNSPYTALMGGVL